MLLPQMVLNHVLDDIELFVKQVKDALSLTSTKNQKKKKKSKGGKGGAVPGGGGEVLGGCPRASPPLFTPLALPPEASYKDFFQKVKYALNLLVGPTRQDTTPWLWGIFAGATGGVGLGGGPHGATLCDFSLRRESPTSS